MKEEEGREEERKGPPTPLHWLKIGAIQALYRVPGYIHQDHGPTILHHHPQPYVTGDNKGNK